MPAKKSNQLLKQENLSRIVRYVQSHEPTTKMDIMDGTGLSWGAVSTGVNDLVSKKVLAFGANAQKKGQGRNPRLVSLDRSHYAAFGLDVNREGLVGRILNLGKETIHEERLPFEAESKARLLDEISALIDKLKAFCQENGYEPFSCGLAVQGRVDSRNGISRFFPGLDESDWRDVPLADLLEKKYGMPFFLEHDPNCLLYEERSRADIDNALLVRIDKGIGLGVLLDGRILSGENRFELGHTIAVPGGERCTCGKKGCLESYSSLRGLSKRTGASIDELFAHPESYKKEIDEAADHLALSIYNVWVLFPAPILFLAGKSTERADVFLPRVKERMNEFAGRDISSNLEIRFAASSDGSAGAAMIAIDKATKEILQ